MNAGMRELVFVAETVTPPLRRRLQNVATSKATQPSRGVSMIAWMGSRETGEKGRDAGFGGNRLLATTGVRSVWSLADFEAIADQSKKGKPAANHEVGVDMSPLSEKNGVVVTDLETGDELTVPDERLQLNIGSIFSGTSRFGAAGIEAGEIVFKDSTPDATSIYYKDKRGEVFADIHRLHDGPNLDVGATYEALEKQGEVFYGRVDTKAKEYLLDLVHHYMEFLRDGSEESEHAAQKRSLFQEVVPLLLSSDITTVKEYLSDAVDRYGNDVVVDVMLDVDNMVRTVRKAGIRYVMETHEPVDSTMALTAFVSPHNVDAQFQSIINICDRYGVTPSHRSAVVDALRKDGVWYEEDHSSHPDNSFGPEHLILENDVVEALLVRSGRDVMVEKGGKLESARVASDSSSFAATARAFFSSWDAPSVRDYSKDPDQLRNWRETTGVHSRKVLKEQRTISRKILDKVESIANDPEMTDAEKIKLLDAMSILVATMRGRITSWQDDLDSRLANLLATSKFRDDLLSDSLTHFVKTMRLLKPKGHEKFLEDAEEVKGAHLRDARRRTPLLKALEEKVDNSKKAEEIRQHVRSASTHLSGSKTSVPGLISTTLGKLGEYRREETQAVAKAKRKNDTSGYIQARVEATRTQLARTALRKGDPRTQIRLAHKAVESLAKAIEEGVPIENNELRRNLALITTALQYPNWVWKMVEAETPMFSESQKNLHTIVSYTGNGSAWPNLMCLLEGKQVFTEMIGDKAPSLEHSVLMRQVDAADEAGLLGKRSIFGGSSDGGTLGPVLRQLMHILLQTIEQDYKQGGYYGRGGPDRECSEADLESGRVLGTGEIYAYYGSSSVLGVTMLEGPEGPVSVESKVTNTTHQPNVETLRLTTGTSHSPQQAHAFSALVPIPVLTQEVASEFIGFLVPYAHASEELVSSEPSQRLFYLGDKVVKPHLNYAARFPMRGNYDLTGSVEGGKTEASTPAERSYHTNVRAIGQNAAKTVGPLNASKLVRYAESARAIREMPEGLREKYMVSRL